MYMNIAVSMTIDMGLDGRQSVERITRNPNVDIKDLFDGEEFTMAAKRAFLGCYYLSSSYVATFYKIKPDFLMLPGYL